MTSFFKRMIESMELMNLFGTLLVVGNVLNSNTFNGKAEGFSLDSLESFNDKEIISLIKSKVNISRIMLELTGKENMTNLFNCEISIETLISEMNEIKSLFGSFVNESTANQYKIVCNEFNELIDLYKEAKLYFGENDDKFISKIEDFLRKLS